MAIGFKLVEVKRWPGGVGQVVWPGDVGQVVLARRCWPGGVR